MDLDILEVVKDNPGECGPESAVELAVSSSEAGSSGPGVDVRQAPVLQQSESLLVKLGLLGLQSIVRQNPNS